MEEDPILRAIRLSHLDREGRDALRADCEKILTFVAEVQSLDTSSAAPSSARVNVFRDDTVTVPSGTHRDRMLGQAPRTFRKWFLSKKIL